MTGIIRTDGTVLSDLPIIFWNNLVTAANVDAESDPDFPASNVANPSTALKWKHDQTESPASTIEYFRVDVSQSDVLNYVAIFGHNFSSKGIAVGLELASFNSPVGGAGGIITPAIPADDGPIIFAFATQEAEEIRIILITGTAPAEMTVVYAGEYMQLPEGIQADHAPLPLSLVSDVSTGRSESGALLGRIVTGGGLVSAATIANLDEDYVIDEVMPFLEQADEYPFFWAWAPSSYPDQLAYAWLEGDVQPVRDIDGYWSLALPMRGLST